MTADPLRLVADLLPGVPGQDGYFPVLALATVDADGGPDVRSVLLSGITDHGMAFHTDSRSRKVAQLVRTPHVALLLNLPERQSQIVVRGTASRTSEPESAAAYQARSAYLRTLAWVNTPETASLPAAARQLIWADFSAAHPDGTLAPPPEWTGFVVRPERITLWSGHVDAPSHRVEYRRTDVGWSRAELPG